MPQFRVSVRGMMLAVAVFAIAASTLLGLIGAIEYTLDRPDAGRVMASAGMADASDHAGRMAWRSRELAEKDIAQMLPLLGSMAICVVLGVVSLAVQMLNARRTPDRAEIAPRLRGISATILRTLLLGMGLGLLSLVVIYIFIFATVDLD